MNIVNYSQQYSQICSLVPLDLGSEIHQLVRAENYTYKAASSVSNAPP